MWELLAKAAVKELNPPLHLINNFLVQRRLTRDYFSKFPSKERNEVMRVSQIYKASESFIFWREI